MLTDPAPVDRSKLISTVGHVSIVIVFCVVIAAMGLTAAPASPDTDEALVPAIHHESKLRARPIPTATWAPAAQTPGDAAAGATAPTDPRDLVCRPCSLLQADLFSDSDLSAPATSSCGRTITLWTY